MVGALACAVLFGGVWLASNIALTFDTLKNPYIAAAYGVVLLCFFMVVGDGRMAAAAPAGNIAQGHCREGRGANRRCPPRS